MSLKAETPTISRGATFTEPGPLCSTAPSTIIMQGIMGIPSSCRTMHSFTHTSHSSNPYIRCLAGGNLCQPSSLPCLGSAVFPDKSPPTVIGYCISCQGHQCVAKFQVTLQCKRGEAKKSRIA